MAGRSGGRGPFRVHGVRSQALSSVSLSLRPGPKSDGISWLLGLGFKRPRLGVEGGPGGLKEEPGTCRGQSLAKPRTGVPKPALGGGKGIWEGGANRREAAACGETTRSRDWGDPRAGGDMHPDPAHGGEGALPLSQRGQDPRVWTAGLVRGAGRTWELCTLCSIFAVLEPKTALKIKFINEF